MTDLTGSLYAIAQPLKNKVAHLSEKSLIYQHYGLLRKATSSEPGDTPGYVYDELVNLSFSNVVLATQLAIYLADTLDSSAIKLKTAKSIHHLVRKGSRQFRKTLRDQKDDVLKKASCSSDPYVAKVAKETREILFSEASMAQDDRDTPEEAPQPSFSGMGSSSGASQGFGNSPISKENIGHKVLDLIDKAVNIPDERAEVLKMCLSPSPVGEYQPVQVPMSVSMMKMSQASMTSTLTQSTLITGKRHVPGKAGGGWESSEDEEEQVKSLSEISLGSPVKPKDVMIDSASEAIEDEAIPELKTLKDFCDQPHFPTLDELEDCFLRCSETDALIVVEQLKMKLEDPSNKSRSMRALLLIEMYLRSELVKPEIYDDVLSEVLQDCSKNCKHPDMAVKARKLLLIINALLSKT